MTHNFLIFACFLLFTTIYSCNPNATNEVNKVINEKESASLLTDTTIINKEYKFSITIPKAWKYSDSYGPNTMLAAFSEADSTKVHITCTPNPKRYSDKFTDEQKKILINLERRESEKYGTDWIFQNLSVDIIGGRKGYVISSLVSNDIFFEGRQYKRVVVHTLRPIGSFIMIQIIPIKTSFEVKTQMKEIISSIKFFD